MPEEDKDIRDFQESFMVHEKKEIESDVNDILENEEEIASKKEEEEDNKEDTKVNPHDSHPEEDKDTDENSTHYTDHVVDPVDPEEDKKSLKMVLITVLIIAGIFGAFFIGRYFLGPGADEGSTIEDIHVDNIEGELDSEEGYMYNGFSFVYANDLWNTQFERKDTLYNIPLHYGPRDIKNVLIGGEGAIGKNGTVYITFDPDEEELGYVALSAAELSLNLVHGVRVNPVAACTKNVTSACYDREIVTCANTDKDVIYLRVAEKPAVVFNNNCVIIQGTEENLTKATDRFILYWYGIMPERNMALEE